ncbi:ARF GTPase-activating protein GIT2 [Holothuria leucospilota]|uniref:ARF GTPase-activating protein GIT2 n=1 Tax=Holothuria leucospilota TaxID=206669 RepID=A0A9Q1CCE6_HOLLE|nr:ARF GTPase-activating protein GIT2 [Holothuria leucospilota]
MRAKPRTPTEICGDCGAADPGWASINRGVVLCSECCSVHRSLGRHVSQIRSLQHGVIWPQSLFEMFHALVTSGSNSIWEHSLLDPSNVRSGKRKPASNDPLHPHKSEFIRAKYQRLDFVHRVKDEDFNEQLHSSVRTGNLETCLRLLSLGAQANFFSEEKGNTPLHVASKEGQTLQCELLMVYGGDPGALDKNGKTPADLAREEGHYELADRLIQGQYELTDRLTAFVCGKKPDHSTNSHFLIPEMADSSLERSDAAEKARKKLQALSNRLFEELAMDVYDEVDRRELDSFWSSLQMPSYIAGDRMVPFLPLNPELSSTRNQGRQKLATFSARDFATLIIDILKEAKRRQHGTNITKQDIFESHGKPPPIPPSTHDRSMSPIDEPVYDRVASDDEDKDYKEIDDVDVGGNEHKRKKPIDGKSAKEKRTESAESSECSDGPISLDEYMELKQALAAAEARIQQLLSLNKTLNQDYNMLQSMVHNLKKENAQLRSMQRGSENSQSPNKPDIEEDSSTKRDSKEGPRPDSVFEDRSSTKSTQSWQPDAKDGDTKTRQTTQKKPVKPVKPKVPERKPALSEEETEKRVSAAGSDYENASTLQNNDKGDKTPDPRSPSSGEEMPSPHLSSSSSSKGDTSPRSQSSTDGDEKAPTPEEVVSATEKITRNIQKLLAVTQEGRNSQFVAASGEIMESVKEMADLFPEKPRSSKISNPLRALHAGANRLKEECKKASLEKSTQDCSQKIITCAYDIAKAAKQLVSYFQ